jgi:hypothetical protein
VSPADAKAGPIARLEGFADPFINRTALPLNVAARATADHAEAAWNWRIVVS